MRFEVPQFIEVEDKIFGPLTWKQFVYLGGGAGALFLLYVLLPLFLFVILAIPVSVLAAGLAFYKHNNRPFSVLLEAIFQYFRKARLYLWHKQPQTPSRTDAATSSGVTYTPPSSSESIASLSRKLEINALQDKK